MRKPTIAAKALEILETIEHEARTAAEIRKRTGFDPHPVVKRDVVARGWAYQSPSRKDYEITEIGRAALTLGRAERKGGLG